MKSYKKPTKRKEARTYEADLNFIKKAWVILDLYLCIFKHFK